LIVQEIGAVHFRNLRKTELDFSPTFNLISGDNAQGKTNLLEAIHFFSLGRSFRTRKTDEVIAFGEEYSFLRLSGKSDTGIAFRLEAGMERGGGVRAAVNGKRVGGMAEVIGIVPTVLFTPEDVGIATGPPAARRIYLDYTIAQISPAYVESLKDYRRVVRNRNALLRAAVDTGSEPGELAAWDEMLVEKGSAIVRERESMVGLVAREARRIYGGFLPGEEELQVSYCCSFKRRAGEIEASLRGALGEARASERRRGYTLVGPHYDDLALFAGGVSLRTYGSQGRKRLAAIVLKLAQAALIMARRAERPAVLLDDIFSELDPATARRVRGHLSDTYQSFITSPRVEALPAAAPDAKRFTVVGGEIAQARKGS
jgi:DNA replication and repair protein RecF